MLTSNNPSRQYASSSTLVVLRLGAQLILQATLESWWEKTGFKHRIGMLVISEIMGLHLRKLGSTVQSRSQKMTSYGNKSSCKVQPLRNHPVFFTACCQSPRSSNAGTSSKYATHTRLLSYHLAIELMLSESSALLLLSMQQVSTQHQLVSQRQEVGFEVELADEPAETG